MALIDDLTGLPNRGCWRIACRRIWRKARPKTGWWRCSTSDIDGFKLVNDSLGHSIGDVLLGQVAQRVQSRFRQSDTLARIGSDEFHADPGPRSVRSRRGKAAESVLKVLKIPFEIEGHTIRITASIGIKRLSGSRQRGGQLLQQADCAMYAPESGKTAPSCLATIWATPRASA